MIILYLLFSFFICSCKIAFSSKANHTLFHHHSLVPHNEWVQLTDLEALQYYTKYEICMILSNKERNYCKEINNDGHIGDCAAYNTGIGHVNSLCPNLGGFLFRHNSTRPWPESLSLIDIIKTMKKHGDSKQLVFVGDSLSVQQFWQAYCTLNRYGVYKIDTETNNGKLLMKIKLAAPGITLGKEHMGPEYNQQYDFYIHCFNYCSEHVGHFSRYIGEMSDALSATRNTTEKITYVVNIGMHYNQRDGTNYKKELEPFLRYFLDFADKRNDLVIFRETTAQHFESKDGLFRSIPTVLRDVKVTDPNKYDPEKTLQRVYRDHSSDPAAEGVVKVPHATECRPMKDYYPQDWRNRVAREVIKEMDPQGLIKIADFYRITAGRHDFHLPNECTHYCHGPMLWLPLWDMIARFVQSHYS